MCHRPITIEQQGEKRIVTCGHCLACFAKYILQWQFRFQIHSVHNPIFYCVTLTYDSKHLPIVINDKNQAYMTLSKAHVQKFFKTLRNKRQKNNKNSKVKLDTKISYMICGEYGDQFKRPHYHAIIFGATPDEIIESWTKGNIHFGSSDLQSTIAYASKYMLKSRQYKNDKNYNYQRPFIHFSKGIGEQLLDNAKYLPEIINFGKKKLMLPRYYANKLGISIDTEKYKQLSIEKYITNKQYLENQGITYKQFVKDYFKIHHNKINELYENKCAIVDNSVYTEYKDEKLHNDKYKKVPIKNQEKYDQIQKLIDEFNEKCH